MKKLFLFSAMLFLFAACSKDEPTATEQPDRMAANAPHFYGIAMLDNEGPATRGVANKLKVWSRPMAKEELTVKFLNGDPAYQQFVKDVAKEWEEATTDVRFHYVAADQEAMIRIGFDYVRGMRSSWSYTGTDLVTLIDDQTEPTMHFAEWRRASDAQKRSDVLRAFGQTLGLELEYRHPDFNPGWKVDENGQIDELSIRDYWEYELAEFISWEELKKMVLDPINVSARYVAKTDKYDPESVMNWPFYEEIASALDPIRFDSDYKTELSKLDKEFIQSLYGQPDHKPIVELPFNLIEFDYTGSSPKFNLTTTKKLKIEWNAGGPEDVTYIEVPSGETSFTTTVSHVYLVSKKYRIVVSEMVEGDKLPETSSALTEFNFNEAARFRNIQLHPNNSALKKVTVQGGWSFIWQLFDFASQPYLKELYLVETQGSRVTVANSSNLEVLATSPSIWKPITIMGPQQTQATDKQVEEGVYETEGPSAIWPTPPRLEILPLKPMQYFSLSDSEGKGVDLTNCKKLTTISLENSQITNLDFSGLTNLDYIYLSSTNSYIVGGGSKAGRYLYESLQTLPDRTGKTTGLIVLRGIGIEFHQLIPESTELNENEDPDTNILLTVKYVYREVAIYNNFLTSINKILADRNWQIVWDSGCFVMFDAV